MVPLPLSITMGVLWRSAMVGLVRCEKGGRGKRREEEERRGARSRACVFEEVRGAGLDLGWRC